MMDSKRLRQFLDRARAIKEQETAIRAKFFQVVDEAEASGLCPTQFINAVRLLAEHGTVLPAMTADERKKAGARALIETAYPPETGGGGQ